jgi:hypothetical protein
METSVAEPYTATPLIFLMESILNENVPETPRAATLARVAAGRARHAGDKAEVVVQLRAAYEAVEGQRVTPWRDALRVNVELGVELVQDGRFAEALPHLERACQVLERHFGVRNAGGDVLKRMIETARSKAGEVAGDKPAQ